MTRNQLKEKNEMGFASFSNVCFIETTFSFEKKREKE
jgi:hypothetical protein